MDSLWLLVGLTCLTGVGVSVLGALCATFFDLGSRKVLSALLSFAAGTMLAVICFDFVPDALEAGEGLPHALTVVAVAAAGCALVGAFGHLMRHEHAAHEEGCDTCTAGAAPSGKPMLAGVVLAAAIAMHNLPAGMSVGGCFAADGGAMMAAGTTIAVLLAVHSFPEAMSMAVPLMHAGASRGKTLLAAAAVGAATVAGALIGFAVGEIDAFWIAMCLAFASGAMLYVLFGEILPEAFAGGMGRRSAAFAIAGLLIGVALTSL